MQEVSKNLSGKKRKKFRSIKEKELAGLVGGMSRLPQQAV
jgi:hypothetical protein